MARVRTSSYTRIADDEGLKKKKKEKEKEDNEKKENSTKQSSRGSSVSRSRSDESDTPTLRTEGGKTRPLRSKVGKIDRTVDKDNDIYTADNVSSSSSDDEKKDRSLIYQSSFSNRNNPLINDYVEYKNLTKDELYENAKILAMMGKDNNNTVAVQRYERYGIQ